MMQFTTHDLAAQIDRRTIVSNVNLDLTPGTVTAIIGLNGSGKSTLLRALAGITAPAHGRVLLDGVDLHRMPSRRRAHHIAFVAQEDTPPDDLLVHELVALGRTPYQRPWGQGGRDERHLVDAALDQVGMLPAAQRTCSHLSGGERRRVMLARGLVQDTPVLMLDEPTNHLDIAQQHHLLRLVTGLRRTIVMAIHDLTLAHRYADQVVVLHDGGVLTQGPSHEVFTDPRVAEAFSIRITPATDPTDASTHLLCSPLTPTPSQPLDSAPPTSTEGAHP